MNGQKLDYNNQQIDNKKRGTNQKLLLRSSSNFFQIEVRKNKKPHDGTINS